MTVRNVGEYLESARDWGFLAGCFGATDIAMGDIDGLVERNGRFLAMDNKAAHVTGVKRGQHRTYKSLAASGLFTVAVTFGTPRPVPRCETCGLVQEVPAHDTQRMTLFLPDGSIHKVNPATNADVRRVASDWFRSADTATAA